ncbi:glycerophosphodiester phosphodiesterase [Haloferula sp.]|uniref:glycerophosphodiester phosphodiesterase n=1 Tax=Haloferula sp. TaxID=2497595 RepID=UPI003C77D3ED
MAGSAFGVECIAHRGLASEHPENTLGAIRSAWKVDVDMVEVDVHFLKDGELVLYHDSKIGGVDLSGLTYAGLQSLVSGFHVPTLAEALREVPREKAILLDLKSTSNDSLKALIKLLDTGSWMFPIRVQSSSFEALSYLSSHLQTDVSFHLVTKLKRAGWFGGPPSADALAKKLVAARIDGVTAKGRGFVDKAFVEAFRAQGIQYYVWTINDPQRMAHYAKLGVDGIITDNPVGLAEVEIQ